VQVYDSLGRLEPVNLTFTPDPLVPHRWTLALNAPGAAVPALGDIVLNFGGTATPAVQDGTIGNFGAATGTLVGSAGVAGDPASVQFTADFGQGPQVVSLNLGAFSEARGLTQFAADEFSVRNLAQDGVPLGAYSGLSLRENGDLAVNYDNGQTRVIYRVPVVAFNEPDRLQRLDGQAFMRTVESGEARITDPASNGVGKLVAGSLERSNVDIAAEFSKLIVAQRAYTANTRIVTTADELLAETINMRR
jgi:flagellar hook protein FlgE